MQYLILLKILNTKKIKINKTIDFLILNVQINKKMVFKIFKQIK